MKNSIRVAEHTQKKWLKIKPYKRKQKRIKVKYEE